MVADIWKTNLPGEFKTGHMITLPILKGGFRTLALQASACKVHANLVQTGVRDRVKEFVTPSRNLLLLVDQLLMRTTELKDTGKLPWNITGT